MGRIAQAALITLIVCGCANGGDDDPGIGDSPGDDPTDDPVVDAEPPDLPPDAHEMAPLDAGEDPEEDVPDEALEDPLDDVVPDVEPEAVGDPSTDGLGDTYVMSDPGDHCGPACAALGLVCVGHGTVGTDCGAHASDSLCSIDGYWIWRGGTIPRCLRIWSTDVACTSNSSSDHSFCCRCL